MKEIVDARQAAEAVAELESRVEALKSELPELEAEGRLAALAAYRPITQDVIAAGEAFLDALRRAQIYRERGHLRPAGMRARDYLEPLPTQLMTDWLRGARVRVTTIFRELPPE